VRRIEGRPRAIGDGGNSDDAAAAAFKAFRDAVAKYPGVRSFISSRSGLVPEYRAGGAGQRSRPESEEVTRARMRLLEAKAAALRGGVR
jgi:hypothetical protein